MPTLHIVTQGECLVSIAAQYGFARYTTIYEFPKNADLRKKRPNPNILHPGDELWIPDRATKTASLPTGQRYRIVVKQQTVKLRLLIRDSTGKTAAGCKYRLTVDTLDERKTVPGNGVIEANVPPQASQGTLWIFWKSDPGYEPIPIQLSIGHLDPADQPTGYQARLTNLGFRRGPFSGKPGRRTKAALRAFQKSVGLPVTGNADAKTLDSLAQSHDTES